MMPDESFRMKVARISRQRRAQICEEGLLVFVDIQIQVFYLRTNKGEGPPGSRQVTS